MVTANKQEWKKGLGEAMEQWELSINIGGSRN
jgi:hypothetical protein